MIWLKRTFLAFLFLLRTLYRGVFRAPEVSVLVYHSVARGDRDIAVDPDTFDAHLAALMRWGYRFVTVEEVVSWLKGEGEIPAKAVAITFDDGYADNATNALPILEKYRAPAMIFLVENGIGEWNSDEIPLLDEEGRKVLLESGLISFGSHSRSHLMLDRVSASVLEREIERGGYRFFAYPGGHSNIEVYRAVERAGYDAAFSIKPGLLRRGDHLFTLRRNVIARGMPLFDLRMRVSYAMHWYGRITVAWKRKKI